MDGNIPVRLLSLRYHEGSLRQVEQIDLAILPLLESSYTQHTSKEGTEPLLPSVSPTRDMVIKVPLARYSTRAAENTAVRKELHHMSLQRQNSFGGTRAARAAQVSRQLSKMGRTEFNKGGTVMKRSKAKTRQLRGISLECAGVECILFSRPTIVRVFLSNSLTCSLIF
jgi:hypothetical protein